MKTHGQSKTRLYSIWEAMRGRCRLECHEGYKYYGALDLTVCPEWNSFSVFSADMQATYFDGATLDRVDNTKGYYKDNCRWVTRAENNRNRTATRLTLELANEIRFRYETEKTTQARLGKEYGVARETISAIINERLWTNGASLS